MRFIKRLAIALSLLGLVFWFAFGLWLPGVQISDAGLYLRGDLDHIGVCLEQPGTWTTVGATWGVRGVGKGSLSWPQLAPATLLTATDWEPPDQWSWKTTGRRWLLRAETEDEQGIWLSFSGEQQLGANALIKPWYFFRRAEAQQRLTVALKQLAKVCEVIPQAPQNTGG